MKAKKLKIQKIKQLKAKKQMPKPVKKIKPFNEMNEKEIKEKINQLLNSFKALKENTKRNKKITIREKQKKEIKKTILKIIAKLEKKEEIKINPLVIQNLLNYYYSKASHYYKKSLNKLIENVSEDLNKKIKYLETRFLIENILMKKPIYYYQWILAKPLPEMKKKAREWIELIKRMKLIEFERELNAIKSTQNLKAKKELEIKEDIKAKEELKNLFGFDVYNQIQRKTRAFEKTQIAKLIKITTRELRPCEAKEIIKMELNKIKEKLEKNKPMTKEEKEFLRELIYYNNLKLKRNKREK